MYACTHTHNNSLKSEDHEFERGQWGAWEGWEGGSEKSMYLYFNFKI